MMAKMKLELLFVAGMVLSCLNVEARKTWNLDGRKIVFIGNSFIYYGGCVYDGGVRSQDEGFFWQLCRCNGEHVKVYNCTYGGHHLRDFTPAGCMSPKLHIKEHRHCPGVGTNLLKDVPLDDMDVVFMSEAGENNGHIIDDIKSVKACFPNPKTKFYYLVHTYTYYKQHRAILDNLKQMEEMGITIVPWGQVVYDLTEGKVRMRESHHVYSPTDFIKNKGDNYHPNPLSGYLTALAAYCAVTGKSAVGQRYDFVEQLIPAERFVQRHYRTAADTSYPQIIGSRKDMKVLQKLVDKTLRKYMK